MWLIELVFPPILQIWYVEVRISRSISESPLEFRDNESRLYIQYTLMFLKQSRIVKL